MPMSKSKGWRHRRLAVQREWYAKLRARGECPRCGGVSRNYLYCLACRVDLAAKKRSKYQARKGGQ